MARSSEMAIAQATLNILLLFPLGPAYLRLVRAALLKALEDQWPSYGFSIFGA
jgi:hypothetical protein